MSTSSLTLELSDLTFNREVIDEQSPVLVGFYQDDPESEKQVATPLRQLAEENQGKVKVCLVNVDLFPSFRYRFSLETLPTYLVFKDGEVLQQVVGPVSRSILSTLINRYV